MRIITLDFETFWSATHSLTKMNPIEYVLHPDTEVQSVAIKEDDSETFVLFGEGEIREWVRTTDLSDAMLIGHNMSEFDSMICAWRFGMKPKAWGCTLAMARQAGFAKTVGGSLAKVAKELGLGDKLSLEATNTKGKRLADFSAAEIELMREYNKVDTDLCYGIFMKLAPVVGTRSLKLIDATTRMLVEPSFVVDRELLERTLNDIQGAQHQMLLNVAAAVIPEVVAAMPDEQVAEEARKVLASAPKFAAFLESKGVTVPMKTSPSNPEKEIPALSKTDQEFLGLQEHDDFEVAAAASARLGVKSTILESRIKEFIKVSDYCGGKMPVALRYCGADTTGRWSGTMKLNQQNLPRVNPYKPQPQDALRMCLRAPEGYKVVVADLSGIELRVNHFLWQVPSSVALFNADPEKADLYKDFASKLYNVPVDEVTKEQRQVGKVAHLGLGYGAGAKTFKSVAKLMGGVELSDEEAQSVVDKWRAAYPEIVAGWKFCGNALRTIAQGVEGVALDPWGLCKTMKGGIKTPQGAIYYPNLRYEPKKDSDYGEWVYGDGRKKTKIYSGKIVENIVQHLAREAIADMLLEVQKKYKIVHTVHDEIILVVPEAEAQEALDYMQGLMRSGVSWWPELITWSEGDIADNYGSAK